MDWDERLPTSLELRWSARICSLILALMVAAVLLETYT